MFGRRTRIFSSLGRYPGSLLSYRLAGLAAGKSGVCAAGVWYAAAGHPRTIIRGVSCWSPDEQLIPAVRGGRCTLTYAELSQEDRAWVVAGLSREGLTAEHIAELLGCSLRTVWAVKAEPATAVCHAFQIELEGFADELRLLRSELSNVAATLSRCDTSNRRLRDTMTRITSPKPLCGRGLHEMRGYNVYEDSTGRRYCRACRLQWQAQYRARKKHRVG